MVEQAAGLKGPSIAVGSRLDDVERLGVNTLNKVAQEQRVSSEPGRIPDNVRLLLPGRRISAPLDFQEVGVLRLGVAEVSKKASLDV